MIALSASQEQHISGSVPYSQATGLRKGHRHQNTLTSYTLFISKAIRTPKGCLLLSSPSQSWAVSVTCWLSFSAVTHCLSAGAHIYSCSTALLLFKLHPTTIWIPPPCGLWTAEGASIPLLLVTTFHCWIPRLLLTPRLHCDKCLIAFLKKCYFMLLIPLNTNFNTQYLNPSLC